MPIAADRLFSSQDFQRTGPREFMVCMDFAYRGQMELSLLGKASVTGKLRPGLVRGLGTALARAVEADCIRAVFQQKKI